MSKIWDNTYSQMSQSYYDRLCIDKALGFWKSDNKTKKSKNNVSSHLIQKY